VLQIKPRVEISTVKILNLLNLIIQSFSRLTYLDFLYCLDCSRLDSWQTVNSIHRISKSLDIMTISGRLVPNSLLTGLNKVLGKSTWIVNVLGNASLSQLDSISRIALCLVVYLSSATVELQLENTCLLVCELP